MRKTTTFLVLLFGCALITKLSSEKFFRLYKTLPPNLKPLEASYEGKSLKHYSFGFESMIASFLWIEMLQLAEHTPVQQDEVSWEYAQLDAITTLDPKFESAFRFGSIFLSTLRRDRLGGKYLLEKWAQRDRTYWRPEYILGMHYFQELGDYPNAAPHVIRAASMKNAPYWVSSLGLRLLSDSGSLVSAVSAAIEMAQLTKEETTLQYLAHRIRSLNYNIQKNLWSDAVEKYRKTYLREPLHLKDVSLSPSSSRQIASLSAFKEEEIPPLIKTALQEKFDFRYDMQQKSVVPQDASLEGILGKTGVYVQKTNTPRTQ